VNLLRLFSGSLAAIGKNRDWAQYFDVSDKGLRQSFIAVLLSLPFFYICAAAVLKQRQTILDQNPDLGSAAVSITPTYLIIILIAFVLMFPICAYIFCLVFDKMDRFKPWVIARHWTFFFIAAIMGAFLGLSILGIIPFTVALGPVFALYMATLLIDIRFAQKIAGFDWGAAILCGCIITAMGLMIILMGTSRLT